MRVSVLGGSSPFTLSLVRELVERAEELPSLELTLHGRDLASLRLVRACASEVVRTAGWTVAITTDLARALEGCDLVVQQIRFDGMEGRRSDEQFASACHCLADETLGPAALRRALSIRERVLELGTEIATHAPTAVVLNLSNPLSLTTSLLSAAGVADVIGICELPLTTAIRTAADLGVSPEDLDIAYEGLNHRGFVVGLRLRDRDLIEEMIEVEGAPPWTDPATIRALGAIPTKYFRHAADPTRVGDTTGRADALVALRESLFGELRASPTELPVGLGDRVTDWYEEAVVPLMAALGAEEPRLVPVDLVDADGVTREHLANVSRGGIERPEPAPVPAKTRRWLERFEEHERRMLGLLSSPTADHLAAAVEADPTIPPSRRALVLERARDAALLETSSEVRAT